MCVLMGVWGQDGEEFVRLLFMIVREREREKERERAPRYHGAIPLLDPPLQGMLAWMARIQSVDPPPFDSHFSFSGGFNPLASLWFAHPGLGTASTKLILAVYI